MNNIINELKKKNHLLDESKKKIKRYTYIINNFQNVNDNIYSKIELYNYRLTNLPKQIIELEKELIIILEKIIIKIVNYMNNSDNYNCICDTTKYIELKKKYEKIKEEKNSLDEKNKIRFDINNIYDNIIYKYNDIPLEIKDLFSKNISLMVGSKKFINGQEYLNMYINTSKPQSKDIFEKFINHYELLKQINKL